MGGYAGKAIAEKVDPTAEAAYWRTSIPIAIITTPMWNTTQK